MSEVKIIVSGPVGSGKSALLGEIEILMKAIGVPVRYENEADAQSEKNMTHADWQRYIEMYEPSVVLVEDMPWLRDNKAADRIAELEREKAEHAAAIEAFTNAVGAMRVAVSDDGYAATFQSMAQYRTALLRVFDGIRLGIAKFERPPATGAAHLPDVSLIDEGNIHAAKGGE